MKTNLKVPSSKAVKANVVEKLTASKKVTKQFKAQEFDTCKEFYIEDIATAFMKHLYPAIRKNRMIYGVVHKVSGSGMSRTASFYIVIGNEIVNISHLISRINNIRTNKDGDLVLSGCGMDMLFNTIYNFSANVFGDGYHISYGRM